VPLFFGVFMLAMGLGMFGLFNVRLPQAVYLVNPKNETVPGAFLFGIMTAILSTPCTAPFGGAAMAWAAFQPAATTLATFAAIGAGMALPYMLLAANPRWVKRMPRTGPASELIKQLMGALILAVAAYFVGQAVAVFLNRAPDPVARGYWWIVGVLVAAAGAWLLLRTIQITKRPARRACFGAVGIIIALTGVWIGKSQSSHGPVHWTYYTHQRFNDAKARGDVIVLDFTAEYCINCKALESSVLFRPQVAAILNSGNAIVPIKADIQVNTEAQHKQTEIQWVSIPLLAVFGPGVGYDEPIKLDWYTPEQVLWAIDAARGKGVARMP
jgi:thiol:disulfide interchange protein DsbD